MSIGGGIIGGILGGMFGGWWGAAIGAWIGASIGNSDTDQDKQPLETKGSDFVACRFHHKKNRNRIFTNLREDDADEQR